MSAALVRQALEFVDQEEGVEVRDKRRGGRKKSSAGQGGVKPYKRPVKEKQQKEQTTNQTIKKLLALSRPASDKKTAEKIVQRAVKDKPLLEQREPRTEERGSILFADDADTPQ